jgi:hypothetical protein
MEAEGTLKLLGSKALVEFSSSPTVRRKWFEVSPEREERSDSEERPASRTVPGQVGPWTSSISTLTGRQVHRSDLGPPESASLAERPVTCFDKLLIIVEAKPCVSLCFVYVCKFP